MGAKHDGRIHEDAMPVTYGITGAFVAVALPFEASRRMARTCC